MAKLNFTRQQYQTALQLALMIIVPSMVALLMITPRTLGKVLGFLSFFLLFFCVILGSRTKPVKELMGRLFQNQAERVSMHCWLSYVLLLTALLHGVVHMLRKTTIFLDRPDVILGDISAVFMAIVALNGIFQRELIRRSGFKRWHHVHLGASMAALATDLVHVLYAENVLTL